MKSKLLFTFILFGKLLAAQSFTEVTDVFFEGVLASSIAFADVDGDNDQDVLITGGNNTSSRSSILYTNDGTGHFTEVLDLPFEDVVRGAVAFSDIDGDEDQDLLITGVDVFEVQISRLYINDGTGHFTEVFDTPFVGVEQSAVVFFDVDGDNDEDVILSGRSGLTLISKLYTNDGDGTFTEVLDTPFEGGQFSAVAFSDIDEDEDQDVLITGTNSFGYFSKLYENDGNGGFTEILGTPFEGVAGGSVAFSDVDGDEDQDVLLTGQNGFALFSILYINDGEGNFTEVTDPLFEGIYNSSVAFSDVDGDNDEDVLMTGQSISSAAISKLYINDGEGNFVEAIDTPFDDVRFGSIAFSDVDGDNDEDVLITGENTLSNKISKLYLNNRIVSALEDVSKDLHFEYTLFPNPSNTGKCNVRYSSEENGMLTISIIDISGHLLRQQREVLVIGQQLFSIDVTSLKSGNYIIQLDNGKRKDVYEILVP